MFNEITWSEPPTRCEYELISTSACLHCCSPCLHSFTPWLLRTKLCESTHPSVTYFILILFFIVPLLIIGSEMKGACAEGSELLWMMLVLFSQYPLGNKGMLPEEGRKDKKESNEWIWWVGWVFTQSLKIHSAHHMVWITAAKSYKRLQRGLDFSAPTVWSSLWCWLEE